MKWSLMCLLFLAASCGAQLSQNEQKAQFVSCEAMKELSSKGLITPSEFTASEEIRISIYSNVLHALNGGAGAGITAAPPLTCLY